MNNKQTFFKVVETLYDLQCVQPLAGISFNSFEAFGEIDPYVLYECLSKLRGDFGVIESISTSDLFVYPYDEENPYPYTEQDPSLNMWEVALSKNFPRWAQEFLKRSDSDNAFVAQCMEFDSVTGILLINEVSIQFKCDTSQYYICKTLFASDESKKKAIDRLDIENVTGAEISDIYQLGRRINEKLALKLPINDFIIYSTKEIRVNPKYM